MIITLNISCKNYYLDKYCNQQEQSIDSIIPSDTAYIYAKCKDDTLYLENKEGNKIKLSESGTYNNRLIKAYIPKDTIEIKHFYETVTKTPDNIKYILIGASIMILFLLLIIFLRR